MNAPAHEHLIKESAEFADYYPDHSAPRAESETFRRTKAEGHRLKIPDAITGQTEGTEYHHVFCEWAYADAVDWVAVKGIATGTITRLPLLDLVTHLPLASGETYDVKHSLIWMICKLTELLGFDWHAFDPAKPEMFVDSPQNMLVLNAKFHRMKGHGIHLKPFPVWVFAAFPRMPGFVQCPDEIPTALLTTT